MSAPRHHGPLTELTNVDEVVEILGGTVEASKRLKVLRTTVSNWRALGRFPDSLELYRKIKKELRKDGCTVRENLFQKVQRSA